MSFPTKNYGEEQVLAEEVAVSIAGIPGIPGAAEVRFYESDEVADSVDTFSTPDGQSHSRGRSTAAKEWSARMYSNATEEVALMETWYAASKTGTKGYKRSVTVTYFTADGTPARALMLKRCFPKMRTDAASGQGGAASIKWGFEYQEAVPIAI